MTDKYYDTLGIGLTREELKALKQKDELAQLMTKPKKEKKKDMPKFTTYSSDAIHQADILELPDDKGFHYALVVTDTGTNRTAIEKLKSKTPESVLKGIQKIYNSNGWKEPSYEIQVDSGSEFKGAFKKYFNDKGIRIRASRSGRSNQQAVVESKNRIIGRAIFLRQNARELLTGEPHTEWIDLPEKIQGLINKKLERRPPKLPKIFEIGGDLKKVLDEGTKVRVALDKPQNIAGKEKLGTRFRETDIRFSREPHTIEQKLFTPGKPIRYLVDGKDYKSTPLTRNELMPITGNESKPPQSILQNIMKPKAKPKKQVVKKQTPKKKVIPQNGKRTTRKDYRKLAGIKK